MDFLKELEKVVGDEFSSLAETLNDEEQYVDTGSYILNALVSGSIFGGVSKKRITAIAGETSTGKTFLALAVVTTIMRGFCSQRR